MEGASNTVIRLSRNQIWSNPILHSQRAFCCASNRREQEKLQLASLIELHELGAPVFSCPTFIRVDGSVLPVSKVRIGVVGLVVDGHALDVRAERTHLEENPSITCYERRISSDNRLAALLYDAHRFADIFRLLEPSYEKIEQDPQICLPETRSFLFNTLARSFVVVGDHRWEPYLHASLNIQKETNPEDVPRTRNILVHCLLKTGRLNEAHLEINRLTNCQDWNGSDNSDPFLLWLRAEYSRKAGETWDYASVNNAENLVQNHAWGFVYQAIARQANQTRECRCALLEQARRVFLHGTADDETNIKRLFAGCCKLSIAVLTNDLWSGKECLEEIDRFILRFREPAGASPGPKLRSNIACCAAGG